MSGLFIFAVFGYAVERWHYTVDIILPLYITPSWWFCTSLVFGQQQVYLGRRIERVVDLSRLLPGSGGGKVVLNQLAIAAIIIGGVLGMAALWATTPLARMCGVPQESVTGALVGLFMTVVTLCLAADDVVIEPGVLVHAGGVPVQQQVQASEAKDE